MKIDRISVVVGRGLLLQGRVTNGTLQANGGVELLGPQQTVSGLTVHTVLIANTRRDQVRAQGQDAQTGERLRGSVIVRTTCSHGRRHPYDAAFFIPPKLAF